MPVPLESDFVYRYNLDTGEVDFFGYHDEYGDYYSSEGWVLPDNKMVFIYYQGIHLLRVVVNLDSMQVEDYTIHEYFYPNTGRVSGVDLYARPYIYGDTVVEVYNTGAIAAFSLTDHSLKWSLVKGNVGELFVVEHGGGLVIMELDDDDGNWYISLIDPTDNSVMIPPTDLQLTGMQPFRMIATLQGLAIFGWVGDNIGNGDLYVINIDANDLQNPVIFYTEVVNWSHPPDREGNNVLWSSVYSPVSNSAIVRFGTRTEMWVDFTNQAIKLIYLDSEDRQSSPLRDGSVVVTGDANHTYAAIMYTDKESTTLTEI